MARSETGKIPDDDALRRLYPRLLLGAQRRLAHMDLLHETSPEDLVQDALEALLSDKCPPDVDVEGFLFNRIRQAASNRARNRQARDAKLGDEPLGCALPAPPPDVVSDDHTLAHEVRSRLYAAVSDDDDVRCLLNAYESGLRKPADIRQELAMSADQLRRARRRLNRRLGELPQDLVAAVVDHLRRAS